MAERIHGDDEAFWLAVGLTPLGKRPRTTLRRSSDLVARCFLSGCSTQRIAEALGVRVALVEDALRWQLKRQGAARG